MDLLTIPYIICALFGLIVGYQVGKDVHKGLGYTNGYDKGYKDCEEYYNSPFMVGKIQTERIRRIIKDECPACGSKEPNL